MDSIWICVSEARKPVCRRYPVRFLYLPIRIFGPLTAPSTFAVTFTSSVEHRRAVAAHQKHGWRERRAFVLGKPVCEQPLSLADAVLLPGNLDDRVGHGHLRRSERASGPRSHRMIADEEPLQADMDATEGCPLRRPGPHRDIVARWGKGPVALGAARARVEVPIHSDIGTYSGTRPWYRLDDWADAPWLPELDAAVVPTPASSSAVSGAAGSALAAGLRRLRPPREPRRERLRLGCSSDLAGAFGVLSRHHVLLGQVCNGTASATGSSSGSVGGGGTWILGLDFEAGFGASPSVVSSEAVAAGAFFRLRPPRVPRRVRFFFGAPSVWTSAGSPSTSSGARSSATTPASGFGYGRSVSVGTGLDLRLRFGRLLATRCARRAFGLRLERDRLENCQVAGEVARAALESPADEELDLLADEFRTARNHDLVVVDLPDSRCCVVQAHFHELQLDRRSFFDRSRRS